MAKRKPRKQPPAKKMTTQERRARAKGAPLTRRQQRAKERALAAQPRSEALEAMSDAQLSPPPDKAALAPVTTVIRSSAGGAWQTPEACVQPEAKTEQVKPAAGGLSPAGRRLASALTTVEESLQSYHRSTQRRARHGKAAKTKAA